MAKAVSVSIIREDDDPEANVRISLGSPRVRPDDFYLVFRGKPEDVIILLMNALSVARAALPQDAYQDHRENKL